MKTDGEAYHQYNPDSFSGDLYMRPSGRANDQLRPIKITRNYTKHAEGSVLIECGDTHVICNATVENTVPGFFTWQGEGLGNR